MNAMDLIRNLVRVGTVSSVDYKAGTVRVTFPDRDNMVSDELPVLIPGGYGKSNPIPAAGESVVCLFLGNGLHAGYCLGTFYDELPGTPEQNGVYFEDGSYVYYDRTTQTLQVRAVSGVKIDGDLIVTGSITRAGELV